MSNIIATARPIGIRQNEPPEGRKGYPLTVNGPNVSFLTGAETYEWKSNSLGNAEPSAIMGAWVDASLVTAGKFLTLSFNNGFQVFQVPGGSQGYVVMTIQKPIDLIITTNNGGAVAVTIILYNYNPLFTGQAPAAPISGGQPVGGAGSGSGGYRGGGGGCFTGETKIKTPQGFKEICGLPSVCMIENETGTWAAKIIIHRACDEPVIPLPSGKGRVTLTHPIRNALGIFVPAEEIWCSAPQENFRGHLYDVHVSESFAGNVPTSVDKHFIVEPDVIAHNKEPL